MSRIGRMPIEIPAGVTVSYKDNIMTVKGPLGELNKKIEAKNIAVKIENNQVVFSRSNDQKETRSLHGLYRALVNNMVVGVTKGYQKKLIVNGVGYKCQVTGSKLVMNLGFSHPVEVDIVNGIKVACTSPTDVEVSGIDKELVGQFAANIRFLRKVEPYHNYGIRYADEKVVKKEGKKAAK